MMEIAQPAEMTYLGSGAYLEDPAGFFRGLVVAVALSVPVWGGLIWAVTKV